PSTAELTRRLHRLENRSHGHIDVTEIGRTNQNRPIYNATVGTGPRRLLYITQQHGDEPLGTPAALEFLRHIGTGTTPWHRW
ncbi:M14 family zinc carboxypeptidase, partial [Nocardiopsis gilva]|uniref:M14 family zinc carboxypeptidase n=1 Tax=Nocardiopsis gilva TaxID=280236 RepID=UPI0005254D90